MAKVKPKNRRRKIFSAVVLLFAAATLFLYVGMESGGFFRVPPPVDASLYQQAAYPVFVYGTLRFSLVRRLVFGADGEPEAAVLPGFARRGLDLAKDERSRVSGLRLQVEPAELAALDRYERLGVRYRRVLVTLADGTQAWVYRRL